MGPGRETDCLWNPPTLESPAFQHTPKVHRTHQSGYNLRQASPKSKGHAFPHSKGSTPKPILNLLGFCHHTNSIHQVSAPSMSLWGRVCGALDPCRYPQGSRYSFQEFYMCFHFKNYLKEKNQCI